MRILALAPNSWEGQWLNRQQLLSRIGGRHTVLYSTGGWYSWDRGSVDWRNAPVTGAMRPADNVWLDESPKVLMRIPRMQTIDHAVMRLQTRRWTRWLRRRGEGARIVHIFHPSFAPYIPHLEFDRLVYHPYDWFEAMPGWSQAHLVGERALMQQADLVLAPSYQIAQLLKERADRDVRVILNGADVDAFVRAATNPAVEPADLARIPHPRIGYAGQLHPQVDLSVVVALAQRRPDWHFVLVGELSTQKAEPFVHEVEACRRLANVHFLGYKGHTEISSYVAAMDVNLMCYRLSQGMWVKFVYPLKLNEYLAVGHPIVSADLESIRPLAHVLRIAHDADSWEHAIAEALAGRAPGSVEARRGVARENSWDARASQLEAWLLDLASAPSQRAARQA